MQDNKRGDSSVLMTLFAHNSWANLKLLEFCEQLSDEQLNATAIGCFGSIRDTLWHIIGAEVSYVRRVNGKQPQHQISRDVVPGFAVMKDLARWASDELLQLALSARDDTMVTQSRGDEHMEYRLAGLIMQAINHSNEHRAQIATIITQLGLEPPDMSGWQYMEETGDLKMWTTPSHEAKP